MDLDEYIFALMEACNEKWTAHASDQSESSSGSEAEKEGALDEMKEEIALQKAQIISQQEELGMLRFHQEKKALEMEEKITKLRETVQKLLESHAPAALSSESTPQCAVGESLNAHTAESEGNLPEEVVGEGERMNEMEDETSCQEGQIIVSQHSEAMSRDEEQETEETEYKSGFI